MKKALLVAAIPAFLFLTACHNTTTPTETVKSAAYALQTNNYSGYIATLGGNAKATYGNPTAMAALQNRLAGKNLTMTSSQLVSRGICGNHCATQVSYVAVMNGGMVEMDVWVTCNRVEKVDAKTRATTWDNSCRITDLQ